MMNAGKIKQIETFLGTEENIFQVLTGADKHPECDHAKHQNTLP